MPAVTTDNPLSLPRISPPDTVAARPRSGASVSRRRPSGFEGEGFPVRRAFAGVEPAPPRSVHPHGPDGRGRVRPGRAQGHRLAPAPRVRDRHLHDRRHLPAPGLDRWRRAHHQRRHPVDDRRRRHPAHRAAAGGAHRQRRAVPRHPAVGQPPGGRQVGAAPLPGHRRRAGHPAASRPTVARWFASSPATSAATPVPAPPTRRSPWSTPPSVREPSSGLPWRPDFNALAYVLAGSGTAGTGRRPIATGQLAVFGDRQRGDPVGRRPPRTAGTRTSRCSSSVVNRSASRSPNTVRSS